MPEERESRYIGMVHGYDRKPKRRIFDLLKTQGLQANQSVTFLTGRNSPHIAVRRPPMNHSREDRMPEPGKAAGEAVALLPYPPAALVVSSGIEERALAYVKAAKSRLHAAGLRFRLGRLRRVVRRPRRGVSAGRAGNRRPLPRRPGIDPSARDPDPPPHGDRQGAPGPQPAVSRNARPRGGRRDPQRHPAHPRDRPTRQAAARDVGPAPGPRPSTTGFGGIRDRALLLTGFSGGLRRSELAGLLFDDMASVEEGILLTLPRSKTDQEGRGRQVAIPRGSQPSTCPVCALRAWIEAAPILGGALFRAGDRHGNVRAVGLTRVRSGPS